MLLPTFTPTPHKRKELHRIMVDVGVCTESRLPDQRDTKRKLTVSMTLIQEVIQKLEDNA